MRERKNITQNTIMYEHQRNTAPAYTKGRFKNKLKYINVPVPNIMATQIWYDCIAFFLFLDKPKIVEIKSPQAVKTYQAYFDLLWSQAKS